MNMKGGFFIALDLGADDDCVASKILKNNTKNNVTLSDTYSN